MFQYMTDLKWVVGNTQRSEVWLSTLIYISTRKSEWRLPYSAAAFRVEGHILCQGCFRHTRTRTQLPVKCVNVLRLRCVILTFSQTRLLPEAEAEQIIIYKLVGWNENLPNIQPEVQLFSESHDIILHSV